MRRSIRSCSRPGVATSTWASLAFAAWAGIGTPPYTEATSIPRTCRGPPAPRSPGPRARGSGRGSGRRVAVSGLHALDDRDRESERLARAGRRNFARMSDPRYRLRDNALLDLERGLVMPRAASASTISALTPSAAKVSSVMCSFRPHGGRSREDPSCIPSPEHLRAKNEPIPRVRHGAGSLGRTVAGGGQVGAAPVGGGGGGVGRTRLMAPISFARGAPAPECLDPALIADCAQVALGRDGTTILSYGQGGGYGPLRELLAGAPRSRSGAGLPHHRGHLQGFVF